MNASKPPLKRSFVFFLVPDFTMVAFATALDPLRIANRMLGYEAYKWRLTSIDGRPVRASNGVECAVDTSLEDERRNAILLGPGSGLNGRTRLCVLAALRTGRAVILDADAITLFGEHLNAVRLGSFALIWVSLMVYTTDSVVRRRRATA